MKKKKQTSAREKKRGREKNGKKCAWKHRSAREKTQNHQKTWVSRALLSFTGEKKHWRTNKDEVLPYLRQSVAKNTGCTFFEEDQAPQKQIFKISTYPHPVFFFPVKLKSARETHFFGAFGFFHWQDDVFTHTFFRLFHALFFFSRALVRFFLTG